LTYKLTLPCTRAEAARLADDVPALAALPEPPVLMTSEEEDGVWRLDAYFEAEPGKPLVDAIRQLVPSAGRVKARMEQLPEQDWVTMSQAGLEPIRAGRFFVHTPAFRDSVPANAVPFEIEAGLAFGTGQHDTTAGCMVALDRLKRQGFRARTLIDVGTGTGLLAFAALHLWPAARAIASDIDPVAVAVTQGNAAVNRVRLGRGPGLLDTLAAPGVEHPRIQARAPYDLVIANILAGPLVELAPRLAAALKPGGRLILAGLLTSQADRVSRAYRRQGMRPHFTVAGGDWPCLVLRKPRLAIRSGRRAAPRRAQKTWALTC
jgi:ribosomal protein L11 methyltransferase